MLTAPRRGNGPTTREFLGLAVASALVGLTLFLPRPMNFAPVGALGLFAGAYARTRYAWLFPLGALTIHTVATGGYHWVVLASVYGGFAMSGVIGHRWLANRVRTWRVGVGALGSATAFFLVSNLGSWLAFGMPSGQALIQHYALGVPYFWNTLAGDLTFSALLFGGYALAGMRLRGPARAASLP